jgi:hypothetical protein
VSIVCAEGGPAVEYGTLPDWIAGIGTAIATIFVAVAISREVQRRRDEQAAEFSYFPMKKSCSRVEVAATAGLAAGGLIR